MKYPNNVNEEHMKGMEGKILTAVFELDGYKFMALDGGPIFKFNPSISFHVKCKTKEEVNKLWAKLSEEGEVLMELGSYPFSERYGWCNDKFGVSWQVILTPDFKDQKFTPVLMFTKEVAGKAEEAANYYASVFSQSASGGKNSKVNILMRYGKDEKPETEGNIKYAQLVLNGQEFGIMESKREHNFSFNEAVSLYVEVDGQEELDYFWEKLTTKPEFEQCGWLKDKYGVSWQIIPRQLGELMSKDKSGKVMTVMLQMKKIDIKKLEEAYEGR